MRSKRNAIRKRLTWTLVSPTPNSPRGQPYPILVYIHINSFLVNKRIVHTETAGKTESFLLCLWIHSKFSRALGNSDIEEFCWSECSESRHGSQGFEQHDCQTWKLWHLWVILVAILRDFIPCFSQLLPLPRHYNKFENLLYLKSILYIFVLYSIDYPSGLSKNLAPCLERKSSCSATHSIYPNRF